MSAIHDMFHQVAPLAEVNLFTGNQALQGGLAFHTPSFDLASLGQLVGRAERRQDARLTNAHDTVLRTHDRFAHCIAAVELHLSYHASMSAVTQAGLHGAPFALQEQASGHAMSSVARP